MKHLACPFSRGLDKLCKAPIHSRCSTDTGFLPYKAAPKAAFPILFRIILYPRITKPSTPVPIGFFSRLHYLSLIVNEEHSKMACKVLWGYECVLGRMSTAFKIVLGPSKCPEFLLQRLYLPERKDTASQGKGGQTWGCATDHPTQRVLFNILSLWLAYFLRHI